MIFNVINKIKYTFSNPLTEEKIIDRYWLVICIVTIIRLFMFFFILGNYEVSINTFVFYLLPFMFFIVSYKIKTNLFFISIVFGEHVISNFIYTSDNPIPLGVDFFNLIIISRLFLMLDIEKKPIFILTFTIFILSTIIFRPLINNDIFSGSGARFENYFKTYQNISIGAHTTLIITIYAIYSKYMLRLNRTKFKLEHKQNIIDKISNNSLLEIIELAKNNNVDFINKFIEIYPELYNKMIDHKITKSNLKICAMTYLGLSNQQISEYLNLEYKYIINKKYMLRKKLDLDKDTSLDSWIKNL